MCVSINERWHNDIFYMYKNFYIYILQCNIFVYIACRTKMKTFFFWPEVTKDKSSTSQIYAYIELRIRTRQKEFD